MNDKAMDRLNELVGSVFQGIMYEKSPNWRKFPKGFRYSYFGRFELMCGIWAFCWSTTRNANGRYVSWVYMPNVGKKTWEFKRKCEHRRMKDAKARALKLYNQHQPTQEKYQAILHARWAKQRAAKRKKGGEV